MAGPADMTFIYLLGGTILALAGKADPADSAALLRAAGIMLDGPVTVRPFRSVGSQNLTLSDIRALAADIQARHAEGVRAFVVAQGTDTMEETSFLLSLLAPADATIIMTGSMRTADAPGAEGPGNLRDALIAARSLSGRRPGVLVAIAGELHDARLVRKMDSGRIAAFGSPGWGPVGSIITGRVRLAMTPLSAPGPYDWPVDKGGARVGLLTIAMDADPLSAAAYADAAWDGLVVEAMGSGHVPQALAAPLAAIAASKPVLLVSRCPQGDTDAHGTYQGDGTASWLIANGLIDAGSLDGRKARLLLTVMLAAGRDVRAEMAGWAGMGVV
ncbi:asparaginase domain-containing protein [Niveispirillum sp.]|uniref:asparaginase n=1 Tax=Niveispirillum sp. TaxID=1917217 RepID=UPI001B719C00|nr:asparaginase domain-containing protein [Niveispirillum sp.]MBP7338701.1 asparaginase [Niveispirillum sp.]